MTLKSELQVPFESLGRVMALSSIIPDRKQDIGRKSQFFHTLLAFDAPITGVPIRVLPYRLVWKD